MKSIGLVLNYVLFFAAVNIVMERYLSNVTTSGLLLVLYPILTIYIVLVWLGYSFTNSPVVYPSWEEVEIISLLAIGYIVLDFSYLHAYFLGQDAFTITSIALFIPVLVGSYFAITDKVYPTIYQVGGYLLIAGGILMFVLGKKVTS